MFEDIFYIAVNTFNKVQFLIPLGIQNKKLQGYILFYLLKYKHYQFLTYLHSIEIVILNQKLNFKQLIMLNKGYRAKRTETMSTI